MPLGKHSRRVAADARRDDNRCIKGLCRCDGRIAHCIGNIVAVIVRYGSLLIEVTVHVGLGLLNDMSHHL